MRRILSVSLENQPGALSRVVNLFSARGYNIESLTVAPTEDPTLSHMTIVTHGDNNTVEQITKQVNKLIEVFRVADITESAHIERELMLVKVRAEKEMREEMKRLTDIFRGTIVNVTEKTFIIQITGNQQKLNAFLTAAGNKNILETIRTGISGITRS